MADMFQGALGGWFAGQQQAQESQQRKLGMLKSLFDIETARRQQQQQALETQRYGQMTPLELEKTRLGNLTSQQQLDIQAPQAAVAQANLKDPNYISSVMEAEGAERSSKSVEARSKVYNTQLQDAITSLDTFSAIKSKGLNALPLLQNDPNVARIMQHPLVQQSIQSGIDPQVLSNALKERLADSKEFRQKKGLEDVKGEWDLKKQREANKGALAVANVRGAGSNVDKNTNYEEIAGNYEKAAFALEQTGIPENLVKAKALRAEAANLFARARDLRAAGAMASPGQDTPRMTGLDPVTGMPKTETPRERREGTTKGKVTNVIRDPKTNKLIISP